jgi:hypothetical protein
VHEIPGTNILIFKRCAHTAKERCKMGIFEDEHRTMAEEATRRIRSNEQRTKELSQVAVSVSEDLWGFIANHPGEDIDLGLLHNQITLRGRVTKKTLEITCIGPDIFRLKGDNIGAQLHKDGQRHVYVEPRPSANDSGTISKSEMVRMVTAWVRERRVA